MSALFSLVLGLLAIVACLGFYFLPTITANWRQHKNADAILILNLFLGWTVIGWIIALIWAVMN
jgi:hypothetical protein